MSERKELKTVRETVVEIGAEGGSITLFRERKPGEPWKFGMGTNESAMYHMLSEGDLVGLGFSNTESEFVDSFNEALGLLDKYRWFRLHPLQVHPEYRDLVLRAVAERGGPNDVARWRS